VSRDPNRYEVSEPEQGDILHQFITSLPTPQNAVNILEGKWVCYLPVEGLRSGGMNLFSTEDRRPQMVVDVCGDITGFKVLELGPPEGAHSYQLERLGAGSILGIDANPEFYLKSLITKEILGLKAKYLLGDFNQRADRGRHNCGSILLAIGRTPRV
jgi:hypothetical protein